MNQFIKRKTATVLKGLFALLPLVLSIYLILWVVTATESFAEKFLIWYIPEHMRVPGLGLLTAILFIYVVGRIVENPFLHRGFKKLEGALTIVPLIKTVYSSIKDLTSFLAPKSNQDASRVVAVRWPGAQVDVVGLLTRTELSDLPDGIEKEGRVAVYFPMSYQIGGYTVFLPKEWIRPLEMGVDEAMKSALTGWMKDESVK